MPKGLGLEHDACNALIAALASIGVESQPAAVGEGEATDFHVRIGESLVAGEVKPVVTAGNAQQLVRRARRQPRPVIVVADRIAEDAKASFRRASVNFLDRRGELRLFDGNLKIDAKVPSSVLSYDSKPLSSQVAQEVAITCLLQPDRPHRVREVAAYIERAPSAVSKAMAGLRAEGLLTSKGEAAVPDLFRELAVRWRRRPVAIADLPRPGPGRTNVQLGLGLDEPERTTGWALTDTLAAAAWGMPIVAQGDYPPDLYVPSRSILRRATALLGEADDERRRACTLAVAPVRLVCLRRHDRSEKSGQVWPVANHIVVALDIAAARARGQEALDQWQPEGITRAW